MVSCVSYYIIFGLTLSLLNYFYLDVFELPALQQLSLIFTHVFINIITVSAMFQYKQILRNFNISASVFIPYLLTNIVTIIILEIVLYLLQVDEKKTELDLLYILSIIQFFISNILFYKSCSLYKQKQAVELNSLSNSITAKYINDLEIEQDKIKTLRHDIKNHLHIMQYISSKDEAISYLKIVDKEFGDSTTLLKTGNIYFDACLNMKKEVYSHIDFHVTAYINKNIAVDQNDICSLMFNLIDNSADAIHDSPCLDIYIKILSEEKSLFISIANYSAKEPSYKSKKGYGHGYGMKIIKNIVEKYEGNMSIEYENHIVTVLIKFNF